MGRRGPAPTPTGVKKVWRRVVREMRGSDVIVGADADVLRCYCEAVARYAQAAELYAKSGPIVRGVHRGAGELVKNPVHQVVRDHADQVRLFARELGLSPSARAGLHVQQGPKAGDIDDVLGPPPRLRVVGDV